MGIMNLGLHGKKREEKGRIRREKRGEKEQAKRKKKIEGKEVQLT